MSDRMRARCDARQHRPSRPKSGSPDFEDQAEQRSLWNLEAALEKNIDAALDPRYSELLASARERLRDLEE